MVRKLGTILGHHTVSHFVRFGVCAAFVQETQKQSRVVFIVVLTVSFENHPDQRQLFGVAPGAGDDAPSGKGPRESRQAKLQQRSQSAGKAPREYVLPFWDFSICDQTWSSDQNKVG